MVIMEERDKLIQFTNDFLDGKMNDSDFYNKLDVFGNSNDETLCHVSTMLGNLDNKPDGSDFEQEKEVWNFSQRILLVLKSGMEFEDSDYYDTGRFDTHITSHLIFALFVLYIIVVFSFHFPWILCNIVLFLASFPLIKLSEYELKKAINRWDCYPFENYTQIRYAVRLSGDFRKRRFPVKSSEKKQDDSNVFSPGSILIYVVLILLAPIYMIVLFFGIVSDAWKLKFPGIKSEY